MRMNNLLMVRRGKCLKALFFLIFIAVSIVFGQANPYKFNYLTVDEGLSHTDANDIAQDRRGYIWIATYFGLDRYDGYSIKKYYNNNQPVNNAFRNRIISVFPDAAGIIWLGTEAGLQSFDPATEKYTDFNARVDKNRPVFWKLFKPSENMIYGFADHKIRLYVIKDNFLEEQKLKAPPGIQFLDMVPDRNGVLYFSSNQGLWTLDKGRNFKKINIRSFADQHFSHITFDKQNNLLISAGNTVLFVCKKTDSKSIEPSESLTIDKQFVCKEYSKIKDISTDTKSDYWVNAGSTLIRLDKNLNYIQTITNKNVAHGLNSNSLIKTFIDRSECLWVTTFGGGVNYCDLNQKLFYTLQNTSLTSGLLTGNHIRSVLEDDENLWIGTNSNGLNHYNLKSHLFTVFNANNSQLKLKSDVISAMTLDDAHNLWIGSSKGIEILKPGGKKLWQPPGYENFPTYVIETLAKDCYGNIWFGNHMDRYGVIWKDTQGYYHVKYYDEGYFIFPDKSKPQLFVSSTHGLKQIIIDEKGNINRIFIYKASSTPNSLSSNYTYPIVKQNDSTYWIGTIGGGLNRLLLNSGNNAYSIKVFNGNYGVFNDVESLEIDNDGNLWMGGNGLEYLNPTTGKLIRYDKNDGLQGNSFKVGSSYKGADGKLYFGGINGLNYFYPNRIIANTIPAQPVLTGILINNKSLNYGNADSSDNAIPQSIGYDKELSISYLQNNFVVYFSAMHFANPLKCKYRYQLVGYDKDWKFTDGRNPSAAYSNLDYKQYTFIVEATNNDGLWSKSQATTLITITPPWWKSDFAKFIYILLILSALSGIYIYQARWYRLKREMEVRAVNEKKRDEMHKQREDLYQQQLTFFTNISHEFRTPLTLILGPLEGLISQNTNTNLDISYQLMLRNGKRLMNLISELMNFKKVTDSLIKLQVQPLIISQFCKDLATEFQSLSTGKNINFKVSIHTGKEISSPLTGPFDVQVLEKILFNLLNNAFKYTNPKGQITFELFTDIDNFKPAFDTGFQLLNETHRAKKYIYFRIADSGIGISSATITRIFDQYYRISREHLGSGVGLALVKSLTQLHKGDIYVYSERYKGTEIIIGLPLGEENYTESEKATSGTETGVRLEAIDNSILAPMPNQENGKAPKNSKLHKHILIVDDNEELRYFLKQTLEKYYYIYEAEDGNSAIEIATEKVPDIIISDVMMPGMSGIELCKLVKERFETSHIPFIILSAKDALATKIEGMESGADFYFAKPLSIDLLLLTVHNIFEQNERLKQRYTNNYLSEATELVHSEKDKAFFHSLLNLIEENIQEPDLDVDFLCKHLYISRTKLYQKIKSITDQSVGDFIRTIRLKKAIQIMTHEDITMNKVVDRVGLQSGSNFSRAFKKEFGKSPLQFMQSLKRNNGQTQAVEK